MKDCVTLLLENRPDEPLTFMGDYFRTVTQPSSPLLRAYRYIRLAPIDRPPFPDNLVAAYAALDSQRGTNGVMGAELQRLLAVLCTDAGPIPSPSPSFGPGPGSYPDPGPNQIICADFPVDVSHALLAAVGKRDVDPIPFEVTPSPTPAPTPAPIPAPTPSLILSLSLSPSLTLGRSSPPPCARAYSTNPSSADSATPLPSATSVARAMRTRPCSSWSGARWPRHPIRRRRRRRRRRRQRRRRPWRRRKMTRGGGRRWAAARRAACRPAPTSPPSSATPR